MNKSLLFLCLGGCLTLSSGISAQKMIRNYGFEYLDSRTNLVSWTPQNANNTYGFQLNVATVKEGKCSIAIGLDPAKKATLGEKPGAGLMNTGIGKRDLEGHDTITVSAYIKTMDLESGAASVWMELKGTDRVIQGINSDAESPVGDSDWTKYTISLPIDPETAYIAFGCKMTGYGMAWFDNFEVLLDGVALQ